MKIIYWPLFVFSLLLSSNLKADEFESIIEFSPAVELSLPVSGLVHNIYIRSGEKIKQGDKLLDLDPLPFTLAKTRALSKLTVQQTLYRQAQRELQQQKELYDRTVLASVELEDAELKEKRQRAYLDDAQASLAEVDYALTHSRLNAPFDAIVISIFVNQGQSINNALQTQSLISLVRQGDYQLPFRVTADQLKRIEIGQAVTIEAAGKEYPGKVASVDYYSQVKVIENKKHYSVTAQFTSHDKSLFIGQKATVSGF